MTVEMDQVAITLDRPEIIASNPGDIADSIGVTADPPSETFLLGFSRRCVDNPRAWHCRDNGSWLCESGRLIVCNRNVIGASEAGDCNYANQPIFRGTRKV